MRLANWSVSKRLLPLAVVGLFSVSAAEAALVVPAGNGLVVNDTDRNVTWTQNANLFKTMASSNPSLVSQIAGVTPMYNDRRWWGMRTIGASDFDTSTGTMTWWGAQAWVSYLNSISYAGQTGWRLPTWTDTGAAGDQCTYNGTGCGFNVDPNSSELAHVFYDELGNQSAFTTTGSLKGGTSGVDWGVTNSGPFSNLQNNVYWSGTEYAPEPYSAWGFYTVSGYQGYYDKQSPFYGWAVRPGQVTAVPVPAAVWLIGSALLGLLSLGRRKAGTLAIG